MSDLATLTGSGWDITSPIVKKGVALLAQSAVPASVTGTTSETALATIPIPAGAMGANGVLRVTTRWTVTNSANNKALNVKLGATTFMAVGVTTVLTARALTEIANRGALNSQVGGFNSGVVGTFGSSGAAFPTGAVDMSAAQNLTITGTLTNTGETITLEAYTVEILNP